MRRNLLVVVVLMLVASVAWANPGETLPNDATGGLIGSCCVFFGVRGEDATQSAFERREGGPAPTPAPAVSDTDYRPTGQGPTPIQSLDGAWKVVSAGERWRAVTASWTVEGTVTAVSARGIAIQPDGGAPVVVVLAKDLMALIRR